MTLPLGDIRVKLDPFYLIVDSAKWIERLVPLGVKLVQLRIKDATPTRLRVETVQAQRICRRHGCTLVLNDEWRLAIDAECEWVHLGQQDLAEADRAAVAANGIRLGVSTHDDSELDRALAANPDYVALGPIYETRLKKMPWAPQGLDRVTEWKKRVAPLPLVAIGGLTPERARNVLEAGADSAAVVTDVLLHADPEARVREWIEATATWR